MRDDQRLERAEHRVTRVAAVDCGTNTIRLLVTDLDPAAGTQHDVLRTSRFVRLGQDVDRTGRLGDDALARTLAAVTEFAALLPPHDVSAVRFCATSAARDASNAEVFAREVESRIGVRPEVVTGAEEAALTYDGATRPLPGVTPPVVVVDIGGGSTEVVVGGGHGDVRAAHSLDIGSVRLTERHLASDPPLAGEVAAAVEAVDAALDTLATYGVDLAVAQTLVGVSGTSLTVAASAVDHRSRSLQGLQHVVVPVGAAHAAVRRLVSMTVAERVALPYMPTRRADVIGAGALILDRLVRRVPVSSMTASVTDILDGIAWSLV